jgi:hypothetical protein
MNMKHILDEEIWGGLTKRGGEWERLEVGGV